MSEVNQAKPQAGLGIPTVERWVMKYGALNGAIWFLSAQQLVSLFVEQATEALKTIEAIPENQRSQPVTIQRPAGLEAVSCNWSALMTLEHLLSTGEAMLAMVEILANGGKTSIVADPADFKPAGTPNPADLVARYQALIDTYPTRIAALPSQAFTGAGNGATSAHLWFGPLNAKQFLMLNSFHTRAHGGQLQAIAAGL